MNPWAGVVDFGVVHALAYPECRTGEGPVVETLREMIADSDIAVAEIAPVKDPTQRALARQLLAEVGTRVVYLPILPVILENLALASADVDARKAAIARLQTLIDEAISFGAPLAMITGPRDPGPAERQATIARLVEDIQALCDYADARATRRRLFLTLENFDRDIEKKRIIGPTVEAEALAVAVDRPNFGLTVDLSHLPLLGERPIDALRAAAPHLIHAHIGNCVLKHLTSPIYGDFHPRFGHPEGESDLPQVVEFLQALQEINYFHLARERLSETPILSMEIRPYDDDTSASVLENGKRAFAMAWAVAMGSAPAARSS